MSSCHRTHNDQSLVINPNTTNANSFVSLEELNETGTGNSVSNNQNGLTKWLNKSSFSINGQYLKNVAIEGKVKVTKLEKDEKWKTYFTLSSVNDQNYIKLTRTDEKMNKTELVVGYIKITNVLPSSVSVIPMGIDTNKTTTLIEALSKEKMFDVAEKPSLTNSKLTVKVPATPSGDNQSTVVVNPYVVTVTDDQMDKTELGFGIQVTFGKDDYLTTYKTTEEKEAKELKEAGFKFNFYSKQLDKKVSQITGTELAGESNKLNTFFKKDSYSKPANKPSNIPGENEGFSVSALSGMYKDGVKLEVQKANYAMGLVVFADYSYNDELMDNNPLKGKVLYTPYLGLININATPKQAGDSK